MNKIQHILTITGTLLIIASCQDANNEMNNVAEEQSAVDTVPKRTDTIPTRRDTTGRTDTTGRWDTTGRRDTTGMMTDTTGMMTDTTIHRYIDLRTGRPVELYYDPKERRTYSTMTNQPVDFYVDMSTGDTIYGRGRYVVNNYIIKSNQGMYRLDAGKIKMDKDDIKIKDGNKKFKMDRSNMKMKGAEGKMKADTTSVKMKSKSGMKPKM
jgi:hypothetical protein